MGTNFYHVTRSGLLGLFGMTERKHIGKSSKGWQFGFRGYVERRDVGMNKTVVIGSWKDWQKVLRKGKIVDEYGKRWSYAEFVKMVELTYGGLTDRDDDWKDAEGWGFSTREFC
jgi:hypothetical protein